MLNLFFTFVQSTPSGHIRGRTHKVGIVFGDAHGYDIRLELNRLVEPQQRQVVLERPRIELRVGRDDLYSPFLVPVRFFFHRQVVFAKPEQQVAGWYAEENTMQNIISVGCFPVAGKRKNIGVIRREGKVIFNSANLKTSKNTIKTSFIQPT